jgi:hypothetical protein
MRAERESLTCCETTCPARWPCVPALCIRILNRWQKAKAAYCLESYEEPADLRDALGQKDNATVARLAAAAHADETALLCLVLCLRPRLLRLATIPRYEHLDVNLQTLLWQVLEQPLASPWRAADEIVGRLMSKLVPVWRKAARRRLIAPTEALPSGEEGEKTPELPAPSHGDLDLRIDMGATVERLAPVTKGEWAKILSLTPDGAKTAQRRAFEAAREEADDD